jgi:hypothetical protein
MFSLSVSVSLCCACCALLCTTPRFRLTCISRFTVSTPKGIEDLKEKREEVNRQILQDEEEKQKIQNDLRILTERFCVR